MKHTSTIREKIFRDIHFYEPRKTPRNLYTTDFEQLRGNREQDTFRKKRKSNFNGYMFESMLNPFSRGRGHYQKPYRETFERKKKVIDSSDKKTDPVTLTYEGRTLPPKIRPEFSNSLICVRQHEQKHYLPAERKISHVNRRYHNQLGFSASVQKLHRMRNSMDSSAMKRILDMSMSLEK